MNDKELLELAAKAAGLDYRHEDGEIRHGDAVMKWNPLVNDGAALRLAVTLNMGVSIPVFKTNRVDVITFRDSGINVIESGGDLISNTRRAIVRAAAEIGRSMK